jgi:peptidoglycan/xylan/chitin deacetylase (PgdA/CDA1 family)
MFELTLSFDNGPEPDATPTVLDVLGRHGIRATFFVIGDKLREPARRTIVERAHDEGHWIGNHTWTHSLPLGDSRDPEIAVHEVGRTQDELGALSHDGRWFRPFAGGGGVLSQRLLNPSVVDFLVGGRYSCVLWNGVPRDWEDPDGWVETAIQQCQSQPWTLLVLHDLPTGAMRHLSPFIDRVQETGGHIRQDFPPACMPIRRGTIALPLQPFVTGAIR